MVVSLPFKISSLKKFIVHNKQNTVPFDVYISSLTFVFILDLGMAVIFTTYIYVTALITFISDIILDQTRYQTVSFSVYIHNLIFIFFLE